MPTWFTYEDGALLIRLILAHIATDFILQTTKLVEDKYNRLFKSPFLWIHGIIAGLSVWLVSGFYHIIWIPLLIAVSHLIIDAIKIKLDKNHSIIPFIIDQFAHTVIIIISWLTYIHKGKKLTEMLVFFASDYKALLLILAYAWLIWPVSFIIKLAVKKLIQTVPAQPSSTNVVPQNTSDGIQHAGKYIGIFERVIIMTLVLYSQYEAIGFLITGKSILRLNSQGQTEYVLAGTLLSYAISISTGVLVNWLLNWK